MPPAVADESSGVRETLGTIFTRGFIRIKVAHLRKVDDLGKHNGWRASDGGGSETAVTGDEPLRSAREWAANGGRPGRTCVTA